MTFKTCLTVGAVAAVVLLGACSSTPPTVAPVTDAVAVSTAPASTAATAPDAAVMAAGSSTVATVQLPTDTAVDVARQRSIYFDYDSTALKSEDTALIDRHGRVLAGAPQLRIRIEGNGDERGSAEYNLALGQRRAETVAQALRLAGARDGQLDVVSWGEEKPRDTGHDESAWAQNRRADLVYPKP